MNRAALVAAAGAATLALAATAAVVSAPEAAADGSVLSQGPRGWMAARRYLQERGHATHLLRSPDALPRDAVLVCAFPWQSAAHRSQAAGHALRGGTLVMAYDGETAAPAESALLAELGASWREVGPPPPLGPLRWRAAMLSEWRLRAEGRLEGAPPLVVRARRRLPAPPLGARVLYRAQGQWPAVFEMSAGAGRVVLLPAEALSNARLFEPGNADLLEALSRALVEPWWFDEYHHGLSMPTPDLAPRSTLAFDVVAVHLALLYVLGVSGLARRFGPAWAEPPARTGSTGTFLLGLGALHHRLGHHQAAARLLLERMQQLDRGWTPSAEMVRTAHTADAQALVDLAREVSRTPARLS